MKKGLWVVVFCLAGVLPSAAQYHNANAVPKNAGDWSFVETLANNVSRFLGFNRPEWVRELHSEVRHLNGNGPLGSMYVVTTKDFPQMPVKKNVNLYKQRMAVLQALLKQNEELARYKFVVPSPADLTEYVGNDAMDLLSGFLRQPTDDEKNINPYYRAYDVKKAQNGVIEVRLYKFGIGPLVLRMDASRKKVFFFYGKY